MACCWLAWMLGVIPTQAQLVVYRADLSTSPSVTERLFMDSFESTPAPANTYVWLVADLSGSGLSTSWNTQSSGAGDPPTGLTVTDAQITDIANAVGNDHRFHLDQVPGTLTLGNHSGEIRLTGIPVYDEAYKSARIFLYLWNDVNSNGSIGDVGDTFGLFDFGVVPPPGEGLGNANYLVDGNVHADRITVSTVPEPEAYAMAFSLSCLAWAVWRRFSVNCKT